MSQNQPSNMIEIEAKFLGGEAEFAQIVKWFEAEGFNLEPKIPVHRIHIYFDANERLRAAGCRLRSVIAPGEWCRYDFKAPAKDSLEQLEITLRRPTPVSISEIAGEICASMNQASHRQLLEPLREVLSISLAMTGEHHKVVARRDSLGIEISWDQLIDATSGNEISEVEGELLEGSKHDFEQVITCIGSSLKLQRSSVSKFHRMLGQLHRQ